MLLYNVHKKEQGFTLTEMLVTIIIAGILAAISTPNLLIWYNNTQVKRAVEQLQGALTEAQRQAMRRGESCTVTLDITNQKITNSTGSEGCLLSDRILPTGVAMTTNISGNNIQFSFKGNTTLNDQGTIVLAMSNGSGEKRCLTVSNAMGIMRTGIYNGDPSSPTSANCSISN